MEPREPQHEPYMAAWWDEYICPVCTNNDISNPVFKIAPERREAWVDLAQVRHDRQDWPGVAPFSPRRGDSMCLSVGSLP